MDRSLALGCAGLAPEERLCKQSESRQLRSGKKGKNCKACIDTSELSQSSGGYISADHLAVLLLVSIAIVLEPKGQ